MSLCASCHSGCCRSFAVPVTGADILRIQSGCGLTFWDFVVRWADEEGNIARNHAPQFHFDDEPETPFVICLMQDDSDYFPETSRCKFLLEEAPTDEQPLGTARCGIYNQRPGACRAFPAKLNSTNELAIIYDVPATGRDSGHPIHQLCPRQWTPRDLDPIQQIQDLVVAKYEMNFFHVLAEAWNRQPGPWNLFPDFLKMVYTNRLRGAGEVDVDEIARETREAPAQFPRIAA